MNDNAKDTIQAAIDGLRAAFPPRPLATEYAFATWGELYNDAASFKTEARGKRWDELPPQFLEFHHDALLSFAPAMLSEMIPAYLAAALRRDGLDMLPTFLIGVLTRDADHERFDARFGGLSPAQRQAITHALEVWEGSLEGSRRQRSVTEALESYWLPTRRG